MKQFKKILYVHNEGSLAASSTLKFALDLAKQNEGRVDLIDVFHSRHAASTSNTWNLLRARWHDEAEKSLRTFMRSVSNRDDLKTKTVDGRPHIEIIREVICNDYDLVIKPIGSHDLTDRLLGRLDMRLLRHCPCPVWLSKGEAYGEFDTVLAAVDISLPECEQFEDALNSQILELAFSLSAGSKAHLHIGHVWHLPFTTSFAPQPAGIPKEVLDGFLYEEEEFHKDWLKQLMRKTAKSLGKAVSESVKTQTHLQHGTPGIEIPKLIEKIQADVLIMGTVARTGISGLTIGNTAEQILDQVTCSVLAVKPPNFVSRVKLED